MNIELIVGFAVMLFLLSLAAEPIAARLRLPQPLILVVLGAVVVHVVTLGFRVDTGLRAGHFQNLIFFVFLPVLIFEAAFRLPVEALTRSLSVMLFLAVLGLVLTTGVAAVLLYYGIGHPIGFPWAAALLAGALLAATDPAVVVAQFRALGVPERLAVLLEGESLFNDATAIVLFSLMLTLALVPADEMTVGATLVMFLWTFAGGVVSGAVVGAAGAFILRRSADGLICTTTTLAAAYGSFLVAEGLLEVSGVMATLTAGLMFARTLIGRKTADQVDFFWRALAYIANGSVFLLMGVTITVAMFEERWLAMLIAIGAVLVARAVMVYGALLGLNPLIREPLPLAEQTVLVWGGLRGVVTLALTLSLPVALDYWYTIQSMAFGVVLFTLFVQAPTMPWLLRRLRLLSAPSTRPGTR